MKILALIPARCGSKRVCDKNIRTLDGKPLIAWTIQSAIESEIECWVSTDSDKYASISRDCGSHAIIRPECLATDDCGDREVIIHFLSKQPCDLIVYLRPTTPFRDPAVITKAIDEFVKSGNDSMRSVEEMSESAFKCFTIWDGILHPVYGLEYMNGDGLVDCTDWPNQRCQKTYHPDGYIDIFRSEVVLSGGSIWGDEKKKMSFNTWDSDEKIRNTEEPTIEIDKEYDWWLAERWLERRRKP